MYTNLYDGKILVSILISNIRIYPKGVEYL